MAIFPADLRGKTYRILGETVKFVPYGDIVVEGDLGFPIEPVPPGRRRNPVPDAEIFGRSKRPSQSAKIIMGFNIKGKPGVKMKQVLDFVYDLRREEVEMAFKEGYATPSLEGGDVGASFIRQHGLWQPISDRNAKPEEGVQIIFFNNIEEKKREFERDIEYIAAELAREFQQDATIVEHMRKGMIAETVVIGPQKGDITLTEPEWTRRCNFCLKVERTTRSKFRPVPLEPDFEPEKPLTDQEKMHRKIMEMPH
jgi:hypothetical protein